VPRSDRALIAERSDQSAQYALYLAQNFAGDSLKAGSVEGLLGNEVASRLLVE
jgi:hypothetical protein